VGRCVDVKRVVVPEGVAKTAHPVRLLRLFRASREKWLKILRLRKEYVDHTGPQDCVLVEQSAEYTRCDAGTAFLQSNGSHDGYSSSLRSLQKGDPVRWVDKRSNLLRVAPLA
jgi:hypothetical protein